MLKLIGLMLFVGIIGFGSNWQEGLTVTSYQYSNIADSSRVENILQCTLSGEDHLYVQLAQQNYALTDIKVGGIGWRHALNKNDYMLSSYSAGLYTNGQVSHTGTLAWGSGDPSRSMGLSAQVALYPSSYWTFALCPSYGWPLGNDWRIDFGSTWSGAKDTSGLSGFAGLMMNWGSNWQTGFKCQTGYAANELLPENGVVNFSAYYGTLAWHMDAIRVSYTAEWYQNSAQNSGRTQSLGGSISF